MKRVPVYLNENELRMISSGLFHLGMYRGEMSMQSEKEFNALTEKIEGEIRTLSPVPDISENNAEGISS